MVHFEGDRRFEQPIEVSQSGHVSTDASYIFADVLHRRGQLLFAAPADEDVRTLGDKTLCRREADAAAAARDERDLVFEPSHVFLLSKWNGAAR